MYIVLFLLYQYINLKVVYMTNEQKTQIKKAVTTFLKAIIPPLVAMVSSILTTLISGDVSTSVAVGCIGGSVSTCLVG